MGAIPAIDFLGSWRLDARPSRMPRFVALGALSRTADSEGKPWLFCSVSITADRSERTKHSADPVHSRPQPEAGNRHAICAFGVISEPESAYFATSASNNDRTRLLHYGRFEDTFTRNSQAARRLPETACNISEICAPSKGIVRTYVVSSPRMLSLRFVVYIRFFRYIPHYSNRRNSESQ